MELIIEYLLWPFWVLLPILIANMTPGWANKYLPFGWGKIPLWESVLGPNKTLAAPFAIVLTVGLILGIQVYTTEHPFAENHFVLIWLVMGLSSWSGDIVKSLTKRAVGALPGTNWQMIESMDFMLMTFVFLGVIDLLNITDVVLTWQTMVIPPLLYWKFIHPWGNKQGYKWDHRPTEH